MSKKQKRTPLRKAVDYLISKGEIANDTELAEKFGLSKGTISTYLNGKPGVKFLVEFEKKFKLSLSDFENEESFTASSSEKTLGEALIKLIDINKNQSDARLKEADNNSRLISLLEKKYENPIADSSEEIEANVDAKFQALLGGLAEALTEKGIYDSRSEAYSALNTLFFSEIRGNKEKDIRSDGGKAGKPKI